MTFILILDCRDLEGALVVTAVCAVIWITYFGKNRHPVLTKILCIVTAAAVIYYLKDVKEQFVMLIGMARGKVPVPELIDLTETLVLLGILCGIFLFWLAFIVKKSWFFYFFTIPIVFLGPLLGQILDMTEICLFAFFHMGMSVMGSVYGKGYKPGQKVNKNRQTAVAGKYAALLGVFLLLLLAISNAAAGKRMEHLLTVSAKTEGYVRQVISDWFPTSEKSGEISRSNSYPSGRKQLEVTLTAKPEESLYLKSFAGSVYTDGSWSKADEGAFLDALVQSTGQGLEELRDSYENRKFHLLQAERSEAWEMLFVSYVNGKESEIYLPYVAQIQETNSDGYIAQMYAWRDFEEVLMGAETEAVSRYRHLEQTYEQYASQMYLQVPEDRFSQLKAICEENPMTGEEEITPFILETLHTRASYTLTPGVVPYGQDPIEYFLFESGKGYCQQFASAAVLMYRLYNIPARYVTGYLAEASSFTEQEDGTFRAVLDDGRAHAWAEVYIDGKGWIPVETTPPGSVTAPVPAGTQEEAEEPEAPQSTPEVTEEVQQPVETEEDPAENPQQAVKGNRILPLILGVLGSGGAIAASRKYLVVRRKRRRKRYRKYRADRLFARTLEVLHFGGMLREYNGTEQEFSTSLSKLIPDISLPEAETAVQAVYREVFGPEHISRKDTNDVLNVYEKACRHVYRNLKGFKRWYFQYGKVYW